MRAGRKPHVYAGAASTDQHNAKSPRPWTGRGLSVFVSIVDDQP